jgi:hypothetical protein
MEPAEKFVRRVIKVVLMILAFVVAFVFGEVGWHLGWFGVLIFVIGALISLVGEYQAHRISRARNMLRNERTPIVEISNSLGFASQSHFTNAFRDNLGVTPNAYRNMLR